MEPPTPTSSRARFAAGLLSILLFGGCGARSDSPFATPDTTQARALARRMAAAREEVLRDDLRGAFSGGRPRNVLALSGGDADGAFGCGVLHGWREAPGNPRPSFDVVTGVSTGALIATFAFLGSERDDQTLKEVYAIVNGKLRANPGVVGNELFQIGGRSLDLYTEALQLFNVRAIAHVAVSNDPAFRFLYLAIPDEVDDAPRPSLLPRMFDPVVMARLYAAGEALGRQGRMSWRAGPPDLDGTRS